MLFIHKNIFLLLLLFATSSAIGQVTFHVTNNSDSGPGSLRQVISDANSNGGTADIIVFDDNFHITLTSGEIQIVEPLTINGSGIGSTLIDGGLSSRVFNVISSSAPFFVNNLTIQNGRVQGSGGGAIASGSALTINNVKFINNAARSINTNIVYGGAINLAGTFASSITSCSFESNLVTKDVAATGLVDGGAIGVAGNGSLLVSNSTFLNNTSSYGGGAVYSSAALTLSNSTFTGNKASYDGDLLAFNASNGIGGAVYATSDLRLDGSVSFQNNVVAGSGGAIYKSGTGVFTTSTLTSLNVIGNIAGNNTNSGFGGGIYTTVPLTLTSSNGAVINDNIAYGAGGGIYTSSSLILDNINSMTNNSAGTGGGAINVAGALTLRNMTISGNRAGYNPDSKVYSLVTSGSGGGAVQAGGVVTLAGDIIMQRDTVAGYGGAFYWSSTGSTNAFNTSQLNSLTVSECAAIVMAYSSGGGIYTKGDLTITAASNIGITNNYANTSGGGIYVASSVVNFSLTNANISNNSSGNSGAGVYLSGTFLTLNNSTVTSNSANAGGGGGIGANGTITLNNTLVNLNSCVGSGGGILGSALSTTLNTSQLVGNMATVSGGGIFSTGNISLTNCSITDNRASFNSSTLTYINTVGNGGGIYSNGGTLTMVGAVSFQNNGAGGNGGGLYKTGSYVITGLTSFTVTGNKAGKGSVSNSGYGAGIYTSASLTLTSDNHATITNNFVLGTGGGIYTSGGTVSLTLDNIDLITNNAATVSGGAVFAVGPLTLRNMTVSGNKAGYNSETNTWSYQSGGGGGVYASNALTLEGAIVFQNDTIAGGGGAIYKTNTGGAITTTSLASLTISRNAATTTGNGGGIYTNADLTLSGNTITIENNSAGGMGGSIYSSGVLTLTNINSIQNSSSGTYGGAIYSSGTLNMSGSNPLTLNTSGNGGAIYTAGIVNLTNIPIVNNRANTLGGGIYYASGTMATLTGLTISNNTSGSNGGGIYTSGSTTVENVTLTNNKGGYNISTSTYAGSGDGGAFYVNITSPNTLTLKGSILIENNNTALNGAGFYRGGSGTTNVDALTSFVINNNGWEKCYQGGGMFLVTPTVFTAANNLVVTNNVTGQGGSGGGMYLQSSTFDFTGIRVMNNYSSGGGGGIQLAASTSLSIANSAINNNVAVNNGGAINGSAAMTLTNDTLSDNKSKNGGGIYQQQSLTLGGYIVMERDTATANEGGAIFKSSTGGAIVTTNLTSINLNHNIATLSNGGALFSGGGLTIGQGVASSFTNNTAGLNGGAIYMNDAPLNLTGTYIANNAATTSGGGIYTGGTLSLSTLTLSNSVVKNNISANSGFGGGIYSSNGGAVLLNDTILGNQSGNGGGIYSSSDLQLQGNTVFDSNRAANGHGGAIYKASVGTLSTTNLAAITINQNTSSIYGGGIYSLGALTFNGVKNIINITGNSAGSDGGGIYAGALLRLDSLTIRNNTSAGNGGGIYKTVAGTMGINGCTLYGNTGVNGGAIATDVNDLSGLNTIVNSTFSQNSTTSGNGGAIYALRNSSAASLNVMLSSFNGNLANSQSGNAIYYANPANKILNGNLIYANGLGGTEINNTSGLSANYNIVRNQTLPGTTNLMLGDNQSGNIFASVTGNIATLGNNGGPTQTLNIKQGGYAYNFIPTTATASWGLPGTDQRGLPRIGGCKIDAGSVEIQSAGEPASYVLKNGIACPNTYINAASLIVSTTNISDTLYYKDSGYTLALPMPALIIGPTTIYVKFITTSGCDLLDSLQVFMYPQSTTWKNGGSAANWNDPLNWTNGIPGPCTNVIIPGGLGNYPILQANAPDYAQAACDTITFKFGGEVAKTNYLVYNFAKADLTLKPNQWYMPAPMLQQQYSGDYLEDQSQYRLNPEISIMYYQTGNPETGMGKIDANFTGLFNNVDELLKLATGHAIWLDNGNRSDPDFTIHFPKDSTVYAYYDESNNVNRMSGTMQRDKRGRFIYEGNATYQSNQDGSFSQTIENSDTYLQVIIGNPYMSHLDVVEFQRQNSTYLNNTFRIWKDGTSYESYLINPDGTITGTDGGDNGFQIPPMQSFIMDTRQLFSQPLQFTPTMSITQAGNTVRTENPMDFLRLELLRSGKRQSGIVIRYKLGASTHYDSSKDVWTVFPQSIGNYALLYAMVDGGAASIYTTGNIAPPKRIDLGISVGSTTEKLIEAGLRETYTIRIAGENMLLGGRMVFLYDSQTNVIHNLTESEYMFENTTGNITGRFQLFIDYYPTGNDNLLNNNEVKVSNLDNQIKVVSGTDDPIKDVTVYSVLGERLYQSSGLSAEILEFSLPQKDQVIVVNVKTSRSTQVKKIVLR